MVLKTRIKCDKLDIQERFVTEMRPEALNFSKPVTGVRPACDKMFIQHFGWVKTIVKKPWKAKGKGCGKEEIGNIL